MRTKSAAIAIDNQMEKPKAATSKKGFRWSVLPCLAVACFMGVVFFNQYNQMMDFTAQEQQYLAQKEEALVRQAELQKEKAALSDASYIERLAREDLGLIKEGEVLVLPAADGKPINRLTEAENDKEMH